MRTSAEEPENSSDTERLESRCDCHLHSRLVMIALFGLAILLSFFVVTKLLGQQPQASMHPAPELTKIDHWINSDGLNLADQKGKVVVLHFWTFGCINCQHNLPYYNQWRDDFADSEVQIIGVHTPETSNEADFNNIAAEVKKLGIKYPVAVDTAAATWKAYDNHYWPSIYLIDKRGQIRFRWDGELEYQSAGGDKLLRAKIKELLAESGK
jgi:peroxiredoxin